MKTPAERARRSALAMTFGTDWKNWNQHGIRWWSYAALAVAVTSAGMLADIATSDLTLNETGLTVPTTDLPYVAVSAVGIVLPTVFLLTRYFYWYGSDTQEFTEDDWREENDR